MSRNNDEKFSLKRRSLCAGGLGLAALGPLSEASGVFYNLGPTNQNWIGRSQYSADPYFNGRIDDFRIYQGALTAAELAVLIQS